MRNKHLDIRFLVEYCNITETYARRLVEDSERLEQEEAGGNGSAREALATR